MRIGYADPSPRRERLDELDFYGSGRRAPSSSHHHRHREDSFADVRPSTSSQLLGRERWGEGLRTENRSVLRRGPERTVRIVDPRFEERTPSRGYEAERRYYR